MFEARSSYRLLPRQRALLVRCEGPMTLAALKDLYDHIYADPDWRPDYPELADFRHAEGSLSAEDLQAFADYTAENEGAKRSALLVGNDLAFGQARMYEVYTEHSPEHIGVFRDLEEALAWLGLPADILEEWQE